MLLLRGPRGLVLIIILLFFVLVYYYQKLRVSIRNHEIDSVIPHDDKAVYEDIAHGITIPSVEELVKPLTEAVEIQPPSTSTSTSTSIYTSSTNTATPNTQPSAISRSDILLIVKTGSSTSWRRMPTQLLTTLSLIPHHAIYSDLTEALTPSISSINILSNHSTLIQTHDAPAYKIYNDLQTNIHSYREEAQLPYDEPDLPSGNHPGWILDRWKFLPMLAHAQKNYPGFKWYIYIEDDTYVFWDNLLSWLSTLPYDSSPAYYGAYSGDRSLNATFAQGGSGIAFSASLMRTLFSPDHHHHQKKKKSFPSLEEYANLTATSCCGDMILGKVLRDHGILVNGGEYGPISFRPEPAWKTAFEEFLWCMPIFSLHHLHARDLVELMVLERDHAVRNGGRALLFRDLFVAFVLPYLRDRRGDWDNFASRYELTKETTTLQATERWPNPPVVGDGKVLERAYGSEDECWRACKEVQSCRMWRFGVDNEGVRTCRLDTVVVLGRQVEGRKEWDKKVVSSGWMVERIEKELMGDRCEVVVSP